MNYDILRQQTNTGWNTWHSESMTAHVLLPYGFCINLSFKDFSQNDVIRNPRVGLWNLRPDTRSWDGTYTSLHFKSACVGFRVESTVVDGEQLILVSAENTGIRAPAIYIETSILWGKNGSITMKDGTMSADFDDGKHIEVYTTGNKDASVYSLSMCPFIAVTLDRPVVISTFPCTSEEARERLDAARNAVLAEEAVFGANAAAYRAMKSCLAWNTIYEPEHDRICTPVSRNWNHSWGGYVLFCWDTYFAAIMGALGSKELAYLNVFAITNDKTENGFVPNFSTSDNVKSRDRSQPPVGSMVVKLLWDRFGDKWFVKEIWPALYRWNTWFYEHRVLPDGTLCWGSDPYTPLTGRYFEVLDTHNLQGAKFESGLDNSPMFDNITYDEASCLMQLSDVGLTGLFIKDCRCLLEMAEIAGHADQIPVLEQRLNAAETALETLWNPETGIYENRNVVTGTFYHRISPTHLYALFSRQVTEEQKQSISARYLCNPDELGGEYMLPSISRSDPAYPDQTYWRGRIWAPMNFIVYEALLDADMKKECGLLAESSRKILLQEWEAHGHVHENYSGIDGMGCGVPNSDNFYHWGGLLGYVAIDYAEKQQKSRDKREIQ